MYDLSTGHYDKLRDIIIHYDWSGASRNNNTTNKEDYCSAFLHDTAHSKIFIQIKTNHINTDSKCS